MIHVSLASAGTMVLLKTMTGRACGNIRFAHMTLPIWISAVRVTENSQNTMSPEQPECRLRPHSWGKLVRSVLG
jgi:hypothetical protein